MLIRSEGSEVGVVAEIVPAGRSGHRHMYKVRIRSEPEGQFIEVDEASLEKTCLPESGTSSMGRDPVHPTPTRRSEYCYCFTGKHHGGGASGDARWDPQISREDEFMVFDTADYHTISDEHGWLYGVLKTETGRLRELGTWHQQIAAFPAANSGEAWHGYPLWPVSRLGPANRASEQMRPSKAVFQAMVGAGLITKREQSRLRKGDFA